MRGTTQQQQAPTRLALAELKSVRWVQGQQTLMTLYHAIAQRYASIKAWMVIGWYLVILEMITIWWWTFLHSAPIPQSVLGVVNRVDSTTFRLLDFIQQRLEWWWDVASVRMMWFRESIANIFDKNLTVVDHYFAIAQDWVLAIYSAITKFVGGIFDTISSYSSQIEGQKAVTNIQKKKNGSLRRNSEEYEENEDWGEEGYPSDTSMDSRRLIKEDSRGESYTRLRTTATAEGKLREAMYHRVKNELCVMRKNSLRFSRGIVNYTKKMVELRTRQYGKSYLEFCQKWVKELGILELIATIQEEMREQHFLAMPLVLVRVLTEAWLAFLLRLLRGKRSRRTRSMRSESLRRRAQNQSGTNNRLPLSPVALQQSSEPVQPLLPLTVPTSLQEAALKEVEEDLEGSLSKDSALGSEGNHYTHSSDSDHTISLTDDGLETDSDMEAHKRNTYGAVEGGDGGGRGGVREQESSMRLHRVVEEEKQSTLSSDIYSAPIRKTSKGIMSSPETLKDKSSKPKKVTIEVSEIIKTNENYDLLDN